MGLKFRHSLALAVALGTVAAVCGAATPPEIRIEPDTLYFGAASPAADAKRAGSSLPAPLARGKVPQALREKAATGGKVRVLVRLDAAFTPEGSLDAVQDVLDQRTEIERLQDAALQALAGLDVKLNARFKFIPFLALEVEGAVLDQLAALPGIAGIEEDAFEKPMLVSSTAVVGAGTAWASGFTGSGKVIAILDTGVDKTHPYFSSGPVNKVVSEACYSSDAGYYDSLCPGGVTESTAPGSGVSCSSSTLGCDHGTHVAGIAAGNDNLGPAYGVARDASIISIQVFSEYVPGGEVGTFISDQIKGLERVYELAGTFDIAAVNMSLGDYESSYFFDRSWCDYYNAARKAAIDNLRSIDIATVASSGNGYYSSYVSAPACISSAISVGATDDTDQIASFANIASFLDLLAPGVGIVSSVPGGGTASYDGTSMAAPHVAGAWAVLKQAHPGATVSDVLAILRHTAVPVSGRGQSLRRLNLGKAVLAGPFESRTFTIFNDGGTVLSVSSLQLETLVPWIDWSPEAPLDVAPGGSRQVTVMVDFSGAPAGESTNRLLAGSTDSDENPYPNGVHLVIDKQACYLLTRSHAGNGGHPAASPASSPGCPPGTYHAGATVQLTALPDTGWGLASWTGTDDDASTALTNTVTLPAGPQSVSAAYYAVCYPLTRTHTGSGGDPVTEPASSPGCTAGQYKYQEVITLTAAPASGWRVKDWSGTADDPRFTKINTLTMPPNAAAVTVNYHAGLASVLLVDADYYDDSYTYYREPYTDALDALGVVYDVWDKTERGSPPLDLLVSYPQVIWYTRYGDEPSAEEEALLQAYLQGGRGLLVSSVEYTYNLTPFLTGPLGVAGVGNHYGYYETITGQGAFAGVGPYWFYSSGYDLIPAAGAQAAFLGEDDWDGTFHTLGVSKVTPNYRTIFLRFDLSSISYEADRTAFLGKALDFLGTVFSDVPPGHWAKTWIEAIYRLGITSGCATNPLRYCPDAAVTRDQMAVFLLRSKEGGSYVPPPCTSDPFTDVAASNPFCPWIKELTRRGVTGGCGNGKYCPGNPVTREQMAVFLLATKGPAGFVPPVCEGAPFIDVSTSSPFCPWIQELTKRGITGGCGGGKYCPTNAATRGQMAVFLVSTFGLLP